MSHSRLKYNLQIEVREDGTKVVRLSLPHGAHLSGGRRRGKSRSYWLILDALNEPWPAYRDVDPLVGATILSVVLPMLEDLDKDSTSEWERWMDGRMYPCHHVARFCPHCGINLRTGACRHPAL